ncbi:hypothetical protein [Moraxella marmotae]|uniref:hypothetical protein n=1 Tax=Moraxella marmotae TaxID=3344520 RepID=UPI0035F2EC06
MKTVKLAAISAAVLLSTSAMANVVTNAGHAVADGTRTVVDGGRTIFKTLTKPAAVSAEVGTLGYGANIAWAVNDTVELQAGWAGGDVAKMVNDNFDADGVNYQLDTDFSNPYLGVQMRPAANWFTVGAGVIVPDNDIKVRANPNGSTADSYTIKGTEYKFNEIGTLEGKLEHRNKVAPYLTVGFRPNLNNNWGVFGEIGATYLGKVDADIKAVGATDTVKAAQAAKDAEQGIEDKDYSNWFPIAKVGVTYRF